MKDPYRIIFEDQFLLIVDKPSGLLTVPTPKEEKNTLVDLVNHDLATRHDLPNQPKYFFPLWVIW